MCWYCCSAVKEQEPLGRSMKCPDCEKDLRSCRNCRFYRPSGCAESVSDKPADTDRANFCDWFSLNPRFRDATAGERKSMQSSKDASASAKSAFNDLFK